MIGNAILGAARVVRSVGSVLLNLALTLLAVFLVGSAMYWWAQLA